MDQIDYNYLKTENIKKEKRKNGILQKKFDKRGFDTMWTFLQMGHQKTNIPQLKKAIQDLILMMKQKDAGQRNNKNTLDVEENFDMIIVTIVCESIAIYLSGKLDDLEKEQNKNE